jgi:hypothetical protein
VAGVASGAAVISGAASVGTIGCVNFVGVGLGSEALAHAASNKTIAMWVEIISERLLMVIIASKIEMDFTHLFETSDFPLMSGPSLMVQPSVQIPRD